MFKILYILFYLINKIDFSILNLNNFDLSNIFSFKIYEVKMIKKIMKRDKLSFINLLWNFEDKIII